MFQHGGGLFEKHPGIAVRQGGELRILAGTGEDQQRLGETQQGPHGDVHKTAVVRKHCLHLLQCAAFESSGLGLLGLVVVHAGRGAELGDHALRGGEVTERRAVVALGMQQTTRLVVAPQCTCVVSGEGLMVGEFVQGGDVRGRVQCLQVFGHRSVERDLLLVQHELVNGALLHRNVPAQRQTIQHIVVEVDMCVATVDNGRGQRHVLDVNELPRGEDVVNRVG
mmetsp:Transcript_61833/g.108661  ORF Transcript_61833/g.108661 Transcript_61833/m.108661 type:complete len:224 (-) Transcript_61833:458-1129(-)